MWQTHLSDFSNVQWYTGEDDSSSQAGNDTGHVDVPHRRREVQDRPGHQTQDHGHDHRGLASDGVHRHSADEGAEDGAETDQRADPGGLFCVDGQP